MINGFSYLDTRPPSLIFIAWMTALGYLLVSALASGAWPDRLRLIILTIGTAAIPVTFESLTYNSYGFSFHVASR